MFLPFEHVVIRLSFRMELVSKPIVVATTMCQIILDFFGQHEIMDVFILFINVT